MPERRLALLGLALVAATALFLVWGMRQPAGLILSLRATKVAALILVGASVGVATVLFQTVAGNRLLTPGIVGFDALFVFLQTALVVLLGATGMAGLPALPRFLAEVALLATAGVLLFGVLLRRGAADLLRMVLTGVVLGVLLRGIAGFAQRLLDPSEFAVVQQASVATFGAVDATQLWIASGLAVLAWAGALRLAPALDVALLGRTAARGLGIDHDRLVFATLALIAVLVAGSTALVGPVTFLGLLAASLAHAILRTHRHALILPGAAAIGAGILVLGQFAFERVLGLQSTLAVIVEFAGGLLFLALVLRKGAA